MTSGRTVEAILKDAARFPSSGQPRVRVGSRWYPRSSIDDTPAIVGHAVSDLLENSVQYGIHDLEATDDQAVAVALGELRKLVWPERHESDTMRKDAAKYVEDWAAQNGFRLT